MRSRIAGQTFTSEFWESPVGSHASPTIALGVEATKQKRRVLFTRAADLVRQLIEARDARELTRLQQRLLRVDVLIVDELGFVPFELPFRRFIRALAVVLGERFAQLGPGDGLARVQQEGDQIEKVEGFLWALYSGKT